MKISHFIIIFVILAGMMLWVSDLSLAESEIVDRETVVTDDAFDKAVRAGTSVLPETINDITAEGGAVADAFLDSLCSSFGLSGTVGRDRMDRFVPVMAITQRDGIYVRYASSEEDGVRRWTEKIPYVYSDSGRGFIYRLSTDGCVIVYDRDHTGVFGADVAEVDLNERRTYDWYPAFRYNTSWAEDTLLGSDIYDDVLRTVVAGTIEDVLSYYISRYNIIAEQRGITYDFELPVIDTASYLRAAEGCAFVAFFQGYPIQGALTTYNRFSIASSQLTTVHVYRLYCNGDGTCVCHEEGCPCIPEPHEHGPECAAGCTREEWVYIGDYATPGECEAAGAYTCGHCLPNAGVHPDPDGYDIYMWNQMIGDAFYSGTCGGVDYGYDTQSHMISVTGVYSLPEPRQVKIYDGIHLKEGHRYYIRAITAGGTASDHLYLKGAVFPEDRAFLNGGAVFTAADTRDTYIYIPLGQGTQWELAVSLQMTDLTEMFGAGYEPSGSAMFRKVCADCRIDADVYNAQCEPVRIRVAR